MICDDIISLERKIKCEEHFDIIDEGVLVYYPCNPPGFGTDVKGALL